MAKKGIPTWLVVTLRVALPALVGAIGGAAVTPEILECVGRVTDLLPGLSG